MLGICSFPIFNRIVFLTGNSRLNSLAKIITEPVAQNSNKVSVFLNIW